MRQGRGQLHSFSRCPDRVERHIDRLGLRGLEYALRLSTSASRTTFRDYKGRVSERIGIDELFGATSERGRHAMRFCSARPVRERERGSLFDQRGRYRDRGGGRRTTCGHWAIGREAAQ